MGVTSDETQQKVIVACAAYGTSFCVFTAISIAILCRVNWRPWRLYSYVIMQKWPLCFKGVRTISGILSYVAWALVLSPVLVLVLWGVRLILLLEKDTIGLAVIMPGTALLLSVYAIMLWWRTQWQSSRIVAVMVLIAVTLLCAYEISAVYVTAGRSSSKHYSASGFFFGVSAIALAINMLFMCKMIFDGSGLNLDEYVRRSYKYAYADSIEVGPVACLPEPPDLKDPSMQKPKRVFHSVILYFESVVVLTIYSILYGFTAKKARWLGGLTSAAVIILDANVGACIFAFRLLKSRVVALLIMGICRIFLICFGVYYWYLGHCTCYVVVASVLLWAVVTRHFSASDAANARIFFLENARVRLRAGFRRKVPGSNSSLSEGHGSSTKCSSSVDPSQIVLWNGVAQGVGTGVEDSCEGLNSARSIDSGRGSVAMHTSSRPSTVQESDLGVHATEGHPEKFWAETHKASICGPSHILEVQNIDSSVSAGIPSEPATFDTNLGDNKFTSAQRVRTTCVEQELTTLFQDKGLDPNFAVMYEETGIHPPLMALLQRASLDADRDHRDNTEVIDTTDPQAGATGGETASFSDEIHQKHWEVLLHRIYHLCQFIAGKPERAWTLFSIIFIAESVVVAVFHPKNVKVINTTHRQFIFGFSALLLSPVICSIVAFIYALQAEKMVLSSRPRKFGMIAWLLSTSVGLVLSFLSKSSILLGISITVPLMAVCLAFLIPIWVSNNYQFYVLPVDDQNSSPATSNQQGCLGSKEGIIMTISILLLMGCIFALGAIISLKPLDDLSYPHGWIGDQRSISSPYTSSIYLGWAVASAFALVISGALPAVSWFATYRFSLSSAVCVGIFIVVLFTFCGGSYVGVVKSREGQVPVKADLLAALLSLVCIPSIFCLCCGLYKWKDDGWQFSRGVYLFGAIGLFFLLGAVSAVIATIDPWMIGVALLLFILLLVLAVSAIHYWAFHNFYLTRVEMLLVCLAVFVLALAAFLVSLLADKPFVGASVGYFAFLFLLAGRALTVLLSCPVVVYSPRLLPAYVYDAHADCAKNVSGAFLVLYGVVLATAGWGVVASLEIYPPFTGAATSAITLVVAFSFAVSRPPRTCKMVESALQFLSKDTIVHAIVRSATKTRNALSGTYSAPQRSASSTALLVGDPKMGRDKGGNYVLPREDVSKLRERLRDQESIAGSWFCKPRGRMIYHHLESCSEAQAHAKIFLLEEALDTEWVYMWDKFGGYLLLLLGLAAKAEKVQDELRLRLFLDSKGFSDLNEKKMKEWQSEDYREFEALQESFIREKEMEDELLLQRREEDGRGKERRKLLLEKEERRRRELEAAVISSVPNAGNKEVAAVAAAARAVAGDILCDDARAAQQVSHIVQRVLSRQKAERAQHIGVEGAVCIVDADPVSDGRLCGVIDSTICASSKVTFAATILVEVGSGPVCLLGTETRNQSCLEILVSGADLLAFEGGQVGLRLVMKGDHHTTVTRDWTIGSQNLADGRWHTISVTIDAEAGEAATYLDGKFDDSQSGIIIPTGGVWNEGAEIWVGVKPPLDLDAFGRSDSEGAEPRMQIMDIFVWGRCLCIEELEIIHNKIFVDENRAKELWDDEWPSDTSSCRGEESGSDPADIDLYVREEILSQEQLQSGRKRKAEREVAIEMDYISRKIRRPKMETEEEVNHRMRAVELAVKEALAVRGEEHFTDQEFPPSNQSIFVDPEKPSVKLQVVNEWTRPTNLLREKGRNCEPCLFAGPADASDVCQGRLGDCWFLSAVAVLTEASRISQIIVTPAYNDCGIYTVRFCIQGEWVPVVVDDWIPCESRGKPAFATSRKDNELWVTLLEKAYAKLHGSYEALEGGLVQDALVDLTGGAGEEIDLKSAQAQIDLASGRLWSQLLRFKQEGFLLGAGSPSGSDVDVSSTGIVQGHAYSVLQVKEVDGHKLLQIHNPWANGAEWNGPWSNLSPEWSDRMKYKLKYSPQADGVFWMSWEDFQLHFCSIYVCRIYPPEMRYSIRGQWRGVTAGGCQDYLSWPSNPQFRLRAIGADARYPIHVFLTLTQGVHFSSKKRSGFANYQSSGDPSNYYIGMRILQTGGHRAKHNIFMHESVGGTDYVNSREIAFEMVLDPAPNGYTIVPSTLNPLEEAPFVLSVFTKALIKLEPL